MVTLLFTRKFVLLRFFMKQSLLSFLFILTLFGGFAQSKLALVVGNAEYDYLESLKNAGNDATDIARLLGDMGFEVDFHLNVSRDEFKDAIRQFGQRARNYDVVLFYYAGHGIELLGKNYFVPVEAIAGSANEVRRTCVSANAITQYMKLAKSETNIIILDACRSNPFTMLSSDESSDGLALMDAPSGTIISFATAPGRVASDGTGRNGVYTDALLTHLRTFDLGLNEVFARVRETVVRNTNENQVPWESTSLTQEVILRPKPELPIQVNILEGDSVVFEGAGELHAVSNLKGVSFNWYYNGRQFSNKANIEVNKTGAYQVKAISQAGQVLLSTPIDVRVKSFVKPKLYILEGEEITFDESGVLHARSNVKGNFEWYKESNVIAQGTEVEVDLPGRYSFVVTTRDGEIAQSNIINVRIK